MEFDKSKILTCVTADQAKVGQRGWVGLTLADLEYSFGKEAQKVTLLSIRGENTTNRFVSDKYGAESLFYPAPEPSYVAEQAKWAEENNVREGTKVRVTKADWDSPDDCDAYCAPGCNRFIGKDCVVDELEEDSIRVKCVDDSKEFVFPYYVLEVVKEPTYRPYNNDELNDLVGEVLTNKYTGNNKLVTERLGPSAVRVGDTGCTAKDLFHYFTLNGESCGVKEEV